MTPPKSASWQNPRILLILLIVFLCGATAGMAVMSVGFHHRLGTSSQPTIREGGKDVIASLKKELDLSPSQCEQLETVLDDYFTYYHTLQAQLDDVYASGIAFLNRGGNVGTNWIRESDEAQEREAEIVRFLGQVQPLEGCLCHTNDSKPFSCHSVYLR